MNAVSVDRLPFQPLHHSEPLRTADWLALYKLQDYVPLFEANGYDNTDFLVGISQEVSLAQTTSGVGGRWQGMSTCFVSRNWWSLVFRRSGTGRRSLQHSQT